ncbi:hypothetical protein FRC04_003286 [Tulasnella sp. 424]|nr:hypothetical protein FRC04_003286 [Tulasnella sp. 424]KAG8965918.1 hypothetical protein FRC05_002976 [Tulasnella sp. 425]
MALPPERFQPDGSIWQYTNAGRGVGDHDLFNGDMEGLTRMATGQYVPFAFLPFHPNIESNWL